MQNEITKPTDLLNQDGNIAEPGFAKKMLYNYNRENITAKKTRLKEWDYYYISNKEFALCLTISDMGFVGALSLTVMDFVTPAQFTNSAICLFPMGKFNMPRTSEKGDCSWKIGKVEMKFENDGEKRHLTGVYPNADKFGTDVKWDIVISEVPEESMVIATPFNKKGHFYFNQKINCMKAEGSFFLGDKECKFDGADSLATLDWGRGVWTYDNTWYWGSLQTRLKDGSTFGWNIGYGFGDPPQAKICSSTTASPTKSAAPSLSSPAIKRVNLAIWRTGNSSPTTDVSIALSILSSTVTSRSISKSCA